jgi:hypothetical protein
MMVTRHVKTVTAFGVALRRPSRFQLGFTESVAEGCDDPWRAL